MSTITTAFNVNDTVYYIIYSDASIVSTTITKVEIHTIAGVATVLYTLLRTLDGKTIQHVKESEIYTFTNAKTALLAYLNQKVLDVTNMVAV